MLSNFSLCQMIAVLPASSVDCERGFSTLTRIKSSARNPLKTYRLGILIRISTDKMDALTLRVKHSKVLIQAWRRLKPRRSGGKGDRISEISGSIF
jgi:hypothetical protein